MADVEIWMPWYPSDYLRDTMTLSLEEDAVYRRAIDFLWQNPEGIPTETGRLCRALRITSEEAGRLGWVLGKYLIVVEGCYTSARVNREREKAQKNRESKKSNGSLGGRPPKDKTETKPAGYDSLKLNETPSPSPSPSPSKSEEKVGRKNFAPPTLIEVSAYCRERNNAVDPEKWMAYYVSNGWKVGKNSMKDWKSAVITWEKNEKQPGRVYAATPGDRSGNNAAAADIERTMRQYQ